MNKPQEHDDDVTRIVEVKKIVTEILAREKESQERYVAVVQSYLPWFDGDTVAWARFRGMLSKEFGKDLDYWLDQCNELMLIGFLQAAKEHDETPPPPAKQFPDNAVSKWFGRSPRTIRAWRKDHDFPAAPVTMQEVLDWCETSTFAVMENIRPVKLPPS